MIFGSSPFLLVLSALEFNYGIELVAETVNRRRNTTAAGDERLRAGGVGGHDGCATEQATEFDHVAYAQADRRDDADRGGLVVHHADCCLVGNHCGEGGGGGVAGNRDHVQADGADGGHGFELVQGDVSGGCGFNHADVLRDRDEGTGEATDV